jgi:hypothetical protein
VRSQSNWFRESDERIRQIDAGFDAPAECVDAARGWLQTQAD